MPVLPLIDLLILLGWTTLAAGGILKAIHLATSYRPTLLSLTPIDLFVVAMAFLGLALTLAARTWVRFNEPQMLAGRRNLRRDLDRNLDRDDAPPNRWTERDEVRRPQREGEPPTPSWQRVR